MFDKVILKRAYTVYKFIFFTITFLFFIHLKIKHHFELYNIVFMIYFLDSTLFLNINNKYFEIFSLALDILFAYFVAKLMNIEELVIFSIVPLFVSCLLVEYKLSILLLLTSFLVVLIFSDINAIFAIIAYITAFVSSYLFNESVKMKILKEKQIAFDKEFEDKIAIAKRMSLEFAHEIRNPLMSISGAIEMLKTADDQETIQNMINIAEQEIERANNLTKDFLNLEKPYEINMQKNNFCEFLEKLANNKKSIIKIHIDCKRHLQFLMDEAMINRLFDNLIRNSLEASAENIYIKTQQNMDKITILFSDDGKGISLENGDLSKIFLPFFTTKDQGSGLGLAICKQIVEIHNGTIRVKDKNTFMIEFKKEN